MTNQSHTELAARLRNLANWIDKSVWMSPEMASAPKTIHEAAAALESPERVQGEHPAPYRCLKPHCPTWCSGCNHAIPVTDEPRMLMVKVLDALAVDERDNPFEEGDHMAVDEARAWLCTPSTQTSEGGTETTCARCNGSGDQEYLVGGGPDAHDETGPCSECDGTGVVAALRASSPAERQPLTDEQIEDMRGEANRGMNIERDDYFKAFRDAEFIHGIVTKESST